MFQHSKQQLNRGGELWVVGNRHLSYHIKLKRLFGNVRTIASNKKFVVLAAKKHQ
jgi:16S rRNA G1207 methylase RsmC